MKRLLDHTLRGYGQMLVANSRITGACVLIGLFILSTETALMSLGGALCISMLAQWRAQNDSVLKTGLFSVNGALLGALWYLFPQVPLWAQALTTALGCAAMAFVFVPVAERMHENKSPYVLFSLPYVAAAWVALTALIFFGVHDAELTRGWRALLTNRFEKAEKHFLNTEVSTDMAEAYRCAGLGWSLYRRGDQTGAQTAFSRVLSLKIGVADAYDGLGWSRFRQGRYDDAELAFRRAVALDSFFADSWDGLGWCALQAGRPDEARHHFITAALCAPMFADAFTGFAATLSGGTAHVYAQAWSSFLTTHLSLTAQFTSSRVLLCWVWFFIGILWHSRTSALVALAAIGICVVGSAWKPVFGDPAFAMNIIVLSLALGGHYLRLNARTFVWLLLVIVALAFLWEPLSEALLRLALLPLCLPFNFALLGSIAFFGWLHRRGLRDERIPIDWASSTPAEIRAFTAQKEVADTCWEKLRKADPEQPQPKTERSLQLPAKVDLKVNPE
ncbi:urea transporter [Prosthecobacter sp.]|uniref:urea transporter n=1 Tax=Prosthecobacter sp. TaxID=1965333 RepID=UPI003784CB72